MQDIKELILLLAQHNIHPLKHLAGSEDSKLLALYEGIAKGKFQSDDEAAVALYKGQGGASSYRKLKSDLRERLLERVFEINTDTSQYSDYQKAYYECHKLWVIVRFLTGQNANTVAMTLANKLMRTAEKFDFVLLCMDIASYLRTQYGLRESNDKKFREANQQFDFFRKVYDAECIAEELYTTLVVRTVNNRSAQTDVQNLAREYTERVGKLLQQYETYKLQMYGYMITQIHYTSSNDYNKALESCEQAIAFFNNRPYEARVPLQIFYYQHLICNVQLRQFDAGRESAKQCLRLMQEGTFNWFKYRELYLHLLLHTQRYDEAEDILRKTVEHPRFEFLPENAVEIWRIYEAFVHYLHNAGKMGTHAKGKFKLAKFISDLWIFSKDKSGMNIAVIIIKWLTLLQEHQFGKILDEVEATEQYCYRHLRGDDTKRSYYFLKMLLQLPMSQFERKSVEPKVERIKEKLRAVPLQLANQTFEIEVVPYEDLWEIVLESLDKK
ncbi:MAG: hypothetical protein ACKVU2_01195 [Saprospiraceae bacterium]